MERYHKLPFARSIQLCLFVALGTPGTYSQIYNSMNDMRNKSTIKHEIIIWRTEEDFFKGTFTGFYCYCLFVNPLTKVKKASHDAKSTSP